jgi:Carboxypeptidase regulatory-like domain
MREKSSRKHWHWYRSASIVVTILGILLLAPGGLRAQTVSATITGIVTDPSGAGVPGARVTATHVSTNVSASSVTNASGYYNLPYLPIGEYIVRAEKTGFKVGVAPEIRLTINLVATVNIQLSVGSVKQRITVQATPTLLELQSASINNTLSSTPIRQLPNSGLDPYSAVTSLAPGVLPGTGDQPIVNGGADGTSEVLFDGGDTRTASGGGIAYTPPLDAVQEVTFLTTNYSAQYGRSGGGAVVAVGTSGTNALHGDLFEFDQNNVLDANSWDNEQYHTAKPITHYNQFGGSIGGPVYLPHIYNGKNRTFFFFSTELNRALAPEDLVATVPTAAQRVGDFSQTTTAGGAPITIYDPLSAVPNPSSPGSYIRSPFPGNTIPENRISSFGSNLMKYFPSPNLNTITNNYQLANAEAENATRYFARVDQDFSEKNRLFVHYGIENDNNATGSWDTGSIAFPGTGINGEGASNRFRNQSALLSDTEVFSPTLVGDYKIGFSRQDFQAVPTTEGFNPVTLGLPPIVDQTQNPSRFPEFDIEGITSNIGEGPSLGPARASYFNDAENDFTWVADMTWQKGPHTLKFGFEAYYLQFDINRPDWPSGQFSFDPTYTQGPNPLTSSATAGDGIADLLLGVPDGANLSVNRALSTSQHSWNLYANDDWKINRRLTMNLGVRWEYQTPWDERHNQLAYWDPTAIEPVTKRAGYVEFAGQPGSPTGRYDALPEYTNVAPRLGLAYDLGHKTVIRAGYGWFYFDGNGGIGSGSGDLGAGFQITSGMFLGPPNPIPNTPPVGATILNSFSAGILYPPSHELGGSPYIPVEQWLDPLTVNWNLNIQHTFGRDTLFEAAYVGNRSEHNWVNFDADVSNPATALKLGSKLDTVVPNPVYPLITTGALSSPTVLYSQAILPYPQYTGIGTDRAPVGDGYYDSLQLYLTHPMGHGIWAMASYTNSKFIDDTMERFISRNYGINDPDNLKGTEMSLSDQDRPQVFTAAAIYQLPFGEGREWLKSGLGSKLLGNWQVDFMPTFASGQPLTMTASCDTGLPGIGCFADRGTIQSVPQTLNHWFDTTAFTNPPPFSLGNDSRTEPHLWTAGLNTWNFAIDRTQVVKERLRVQFRAEFFNAFNTPNFGSPVMSVSAPNFGQVTGTENGPRVIQLGLRFSF